MLRNGRMIGEILHTHINAIGFIGKENEKKEKEIGEDNDKTCKNNSEK